METGVELRLSILEKNNESLIKKIGELEMSILSLEKGNELVTYKFDQIMTAVDKLNEKFDDFTNVPKGRWELVITSIITAITTGLVGMFILKK